MKLWRLLGKIFCFSFFAVLGAAAGIAVFSSLMVVRVEGASMLPQLEPGDRLLAVRESPITGTLQLKTGDLIIYEAPFYTTDGEGLEKVRRITGTRGSWIRLNCDVKTVRNEEILAQREDILGKGILVIPRLEIF